MLCFHSTPVQEAQRVADAERAAAAVVNEERVEYRREQQQIKQEEKLARAIEVIFDSIVLLLPAFAVPSWLLCAGGGRGAAARGTTGRTAVHTEPPESFLADRRCFGLVCRQLVAVKAQRDPGNSLQRVCPYVLTRFVSLPAERVLQATASTSMPGEQSASVVFSAAPCCSSRLTAALCCCRRGVVCGARLQLGYACFPVQHDLSSWSAPQTL